METVKSKMTIKELITLSNENKLEPIYFGLRTKWEVKTKENFLNFIKRYSFGLIKSLVLNLNSDGIYQIVDGKKRIEAILEYIKTLDLDKLSKFEIEDIDVTIIKDASPGKVKEIYDTINCVVPLNEAERRKRFIRDEKKEIVDKLLDHNFFKNCLIQGSKNNMADMDCVVLLLAFCNCKNFYNADKATLPSSLIEFVKNELSNRINIDYAFSTLSYMESILKGTDYVCRAIDFCYMAIFTIFDINNYSHEEDLTEEEFRVIFNEYTEMCKNIDPCIFLNPLANENLEKIQMNLYKICADIYEERIKYDE